MDLKALRQFRDCLLAFDGDKCHFRFEGRRVVPARTSCQAMLLIEGFFASDGADSSLKPLSNYPAPPLRRLLRTYTVLFKVSNVDYPVDGVFVFFKAMHYQDGCFAFRFCQQRLHCDVLATLV